MKPVETGSFPLSEIEIGKRLRGVDEDWAKGLAAIIEATGLQHPIQLLKVGNAHQLVSGRHRLRAFELLGRTHIPAHIYEPETDRPDLELRRSEIVENIGRRELNPLDRAAHIAELAEIERELSGERRGGDRKSEKSKVQQLHFWSLGDDVAAKMGLSKRTIFADIELHKGLSAATRKRVAGTWMADNRAQLRDLAKLDAEGQHKALDLMLGEEPKARRVAEAVAIIEKRPKAKTDHAKAYAKLQKAWLDAPKAVRTQFIAFLGEQGFTLMKGDA